MKQIILIIAISAIANFSFGQTVQSAAFSESYQFEFNKDYSKAISLFENALKVNPEDVFLQRNYILSLIESGNKEKITQMMKELEEKYWFVDLELHPKIKNLPKEAIMKLSEII